MKLIRLFEDGMQAIEQATIQTLNLPITLETKVAQTEDDIIRLAQEADGLITVYEPLTRRVLESLPRLKVILYRSIGFNMVDMEAANELGILVSHVTKYCVDEVANYVLAAILSHNRRLVDYHQLTQQHIWDCERFPDMRRLSSLTVGLIGFGNIPRLISQRLKPFGPKVIAYDPFVDEESFAQLGVQSVELDELFKQSDYISCHLPLLPSTKEIVNQTLFQQTTKSPVFINSSRGGVINEKDLLEALQTKQISYAILDVLSSEQPQLDQCPFVHLDNVVLTPHVAFYSQEAFKQGAEDNFYNLKAILANDLRKGEVVNAKDCATPRLFL